LRLNGPPTFLITAACRRAFQPPTASMRFFALQRFGSGRFTHRGLYLPASAPSAGFGYPLDGLLPAQPRRTYFRPAALLGFALQRLLSVCGETAFLPFRTDRVVGNPSAGPHFWHGQTAGSSASRLCPASVPVARLRLLPRNRARASPGLVLSAVCPSTGWARPSANLRPLAWPVHGHPQTISAPLGVFSPADHSDPSFAGRSRQTPGLTARFGPEHRSEVLAPFHDSETESRPRGRA